MHNEPLAPTDSLIGARTQRLGHLRAINAITHQQAVDQLVTYAGGALTRRGAELQLTAYKSAAARFATVEADATVRVAGPANPRDFARADLRFNLGRAA
ncbi:MAG TPA: hypothetical protein VIQ30_25520 [Pseudonocardia sp.]